MQSFLTICYMNTLWPEAWWFMIIVRKKERKGEKSTLWCVKNISYRHKGLFSAVYKRDKNEASRIDLKDTIHDLLQKRVISKLVYVTLFLFFTCKQEQSKQCYWYTSCHDCYRPIIQINLRAYVTVLQVHHCSSTILLGGIEQKA